MVSDHESSPLEERTDHAWREGIDALAAQVTRALSRRYGLIFSSQMRPIGAYPFPISGGDVDPLAYLSPETSPRGAMIRLYARGRDSLRGIDDIRSPDRTIGRLVVLDGQLHLDLREAQFERVVREAIETYRGEAFSTPARSFDP